MKLPKFVKLMGILTALSLIYINLQMQIFDLAYKGKYKEKELRRLSDENSSVSYGILKLKSSNNLGGKLLNDRSGLEFVDNTRVVKMPTNGRAGKVKLLAATTVQPERKPSLLAGLFSLRSQAEARPIE